MPGAHRPPPDHRMRRPGGRLHPSSHPHLDPGPASGSRSSGSSRSSSRPAIRCSPPSTPRSWRTSWPQPGAARSRASSARLRPADLPQPVPDAGWATSSRATSGYSITSKRSIAYEIGSRLPADAAADGHRADDGGPDRHPDRRHHRRQAVLEARLRPERGWRSSWPRRPSSSSGLIAIYVFAVNLALLPDRPDPHGRADRHRSTSLAT